MYRNKRVSIYFPCRNESGHLDKVLASVPSFVDEIIVVSNKSTDDTVARARELGIHAIEDNRTSGGIGYGYAHMSGIEAATGDIIVTADADCTYPTDKLQSILDHFIDTDLQFMSCNRYPLQAGTHIPFKLRLGVTVLNLEVLLLYGYRMKDILSGMWVMSADAKEQLTLTMGDWNLSPEIKLNAMMNDDIRFAEFPIVQYDRHGESHQVHWKTGFGHLLWIARYRIKTLLRFSAPRLQASDFDDLA